MREFTKKGKNTDGCLNANNLGHFDTNEHDRFHAYFVVVHEKQLKPI